MREKTLAILSIPTLSTTEPLPFFILNENIFRTKNDNLEKIQFPRELNFLFVYLCFESNDFSITIVWFSIIFFLYSGFLHTSVEVMWTKNAVHWLNFSIDSEQCNFFWKEEITRLYMTRNVTYRFDKSKIAYLHSHPIDICSMIFDLICLQ